MGILSSPRGFRISHLMFVDDCLVFAKANHKVASTIRDILDKYSRVSGQKVNFHELVIFFSPNYNR